MGRRAGDGIATNANGRKFRGGVWENGQLIKEVKLILEKHAPTKSQYPSAPPETRHACATRPHCAAHNALHALLQRLTPPAACAQSAAWATTLCACGCMRRRRA